MSAADLGSGIFMAIPATVAAIANIKTRQEDVLCGIQAFLACLCGYSAILSLLCLTADRFISVVFALRYPALVTKKRARILVCFMWGLATLLVVQLGIVAKWTSKYNSNFLLCHFDSQGSQITIHLEALTTPICAICLLIVLVAYTKLLMISHEQAKRIADANQNVQMAGRDRPNTKAPKTVLLVVLSSVVFMLLPILFLSLRLYKKQSALLPLLMYIMPVLTNSWFNVAVYYLRNKEFHEVAKGLVVSYYQSLRQLIPFPPN